MMVYLFDRHTQVSLSFLLHSIVHDSVLAVGIDSTAFDNRLAYDMAHVWRYCSSLKSQAFHTRYFAECAHFAPRYGDSLHLASSMVASRLGHADGGAHRRVNGAEVSNSLPRDEAKVTNTESKGLPMRWSSLDHLYLTLRSCQADAEHFQSFGVHSSKHEELAVEIALEQSLHSNSRSREANSASSFGHIDAPDMFVYSSTLAFPYVRPDYSCFLRLLCCINAIESGLKAPSQPK